MLTYTTTTDDPSQNEAVESAQLADVLGKGAAPKQPPATRKSTARGYQNPKGRDRSKDESGDAYPGTLFDIPRTAWRVAVCREGRQWMLQQREAKDRWQSRKFFARKQRLATVVQQLLGTAAYKSVAAKIDALPV
jgi:hypothetical protein